jgi:hypothetical protein
VTQEAIALAERTLKLSGTAVAIARTAVTAKASIPAEAATRAVQMSTAAGGALTSKSGVEIVTTLGRNLDIERELLATGAGTRGGQASRSILLTVTTTVNVDG